MNYQSKKAFILKMGELSTLFGFSHILGQIYGILYVNARELSLDEIKDALEVSKATVSLNIRELLKWGAVKKIWKPGTRRDYYEPETDFLKIFNMRLADALMRRIGVFQEAATVPSDKAGASLSEEDKLIQCRLEELRKMSRAFSKLLQSVKDIEKHSFLKKVLKSIS